MSVVICRLGLDTQMGRSSELGDAHAPTSLQTTLRLHPPPAVSSRTFLGGFQAPSNDILFPSSLPPSLLSPYSLLPFPLSSPFFSHLRWKLVRVSFMDDFSWRKKNGLCYGLNCVPLKLRCGNLNPSISECDCI